MNWDALLSDSAKRMTRSSVREFIKVAAQPGMISFGGGLPAPEHFPMEAIETATKRAMAKHGPRPLQYGEAEGVGALREWIAAKYSTATCKLTRENILMLTGSQQGLDIIGRILINQGDRIAVENPTYIAALSAWRPLGAAFTPLASDDDGPILADLRRELASTNLLYLVPNFHNPTGRTISKLRREEIVRELSAHRCPLLEDNPYGELRYEGTAETHLFQTAAELGQSNSIYLGSFSKTLVPGMRVGYIIAPQAILEHAIRCKQAMDLHTSTFSQHVILELLESGMMTSHLENLRLAYRTRRDAMLNALSAFMPTGVTWTKPLGGFFIFVTLPQNLKAKDVWPRALARSVAFVPGDEFHVGTPVENTIRLNFSNPTTEQIRQGIRALAEAINETPKA